MIFGGEALELRGLVPWFEQYSDSQPALVNMYKITETTVHMTFQRIRKALIPEGSKREAYFLKLFRS